MLSLRPARPPVRACAQISKLVAHGVDRPAALAGMRRALDAYVIRGLQHNAPLLRSVLDAPAFVAGHISTAFLAEHYPEAEASSPHRLPLTPQQEEQLLALAALLWVGKEQRLSGGDGLQVGAQWGWLYAYAAHAAVLQVPVRHLQCSALQAGAVLCTGPYPLNNVCPLCPLPAG